MFLITEWTEQYLEVIFKAVLYLSGEEIFYQNICQDNNVVLSLKVPKSLFAFFHQDVTHKIVDAIGAIAGSSLEQTTWLRRNLEVKPSPKIMVDGNNLESDVEGSFVLILFILNETFK